MIVIISVGHDSTAHKVIDWLYYKNKKSLRIGYNTKITNLNIDVNRKEYLLEIIGGKEKINLDFGEINSFWYRNGDIDYNFDNVEYVDSQDVLRYFQLEWNALKDFLIDELEKKSYYGNYFLRNQNKLKNIILAKECGFLIPTTSIITQSKDALNIKEENLVTKSICENIQIGQKNKLLKMLTESVTKTEITKNNSSFFPSLLQDRIEKKYELRIFFWGKVIKAMCIFSQLDKGTEVDLRNYSIDKVTRCVPYALPKKIKDRVKKFIKRSELNTGSIDMIVDSEDNFYFLEVNPNGQFDNVSYYCNYYLEELIAEDL